VARGLQSQSVEVSLTVRASLHDAHVRSALEDVAWRVQAYCRHRPGNLAGISLRVPVGTVWDHFGEDLVSRLAELGLDAGQVHTTRSGDRVELVSMEFER